MEDYDDNDNQIKGDLLSRPQRKLWLSHRDFYCWLQVGAGDIVPDDIDIDINNDINLISDDLDDIDADIDTWNDDAPLC